MFTNLRSTDNTIRQQAEQELYTQVAANPIAILEQFLIAMQNKDDTEFVSILLSKTIFENEENIGKLEWSHVEAVLKFCVSELKQENKLSHLKRMCDLAVKGLLKFTKYDEMIMLLFEIGRSAQTLNQKLATMYYIEIMCEFALCDEQLIKHSQQLNEIFSAFLNDQSPQVRAATCQGISSFLVSIEEESLLNRFSNNAVVLLQQFAQVMQVDQEASVQALQSINELLENHPKFMKNLYGELLNIYTQLMGSQTTISLKKSALHGLQTLCQIAPAFIRKSDQFKTSSILMIMKMLTEVDRKDWENTFDDNCLQLNDLSSVAEDCLGKMVRDLGVKYLLPIFVPLIMQALRSPVINEQHAGLIAMATLSDKAAEHFQNELPSIMELILPLSQSQNKLIIYDLLTCLASLCQEFTPKIQINYGSQILQLIVTCMQQKISQKIQYISIACLVDFTRELVEDKEAAKNVLTPVSTFLIEQLYSVIQTNLTGSIDQQQQQILEQALSAFSALATSLQEHFTQYYDQMMPYMMQMMQTVTVNEVKSLLLECIGCFLVSISTTRKEQCKTDSNQLVTHFIQQQNKMESDDPAHTSIFFFYTQVATALRCEFGQYLDAIFPLVERAMRLDVGFSINSQAEGKNITKVKLDLKFLGMKSLSLNTSALEQKVEGAHTLVNLAEQCGKSFYPYITKTIVLMKEFINYKHSSQIQKSMAKCSEYLIAACTLETDMAQVLIQVTPMLITEFTVFLNSKSYDRAAEIAEVLANCLNQVKAPILDATIIDSMFQTCNKALAAIVKTKESITYEDEEQFEADCEEIDLLLDHITNIATELISNHKCESVQTMMPTYYSFLNTKSTKSQTINSIAFFNIVLPLCNESVFQQAQNEILKCYSTFSKTADLEMKQNLLFGYGNIAKRLPTLDTTQIIELAQTIIEQPDCKHVDKVASYETALTTLGKVAMYCNIAQKEQLLTKFLDSLPHEYQDNQETHLMFIKEVQNNNPTLMQFKDSVIQTLNRIKTQDCNNPENELLCDEGRKLIQQLLC
ncbi:unnamed protein product [Paramecium primaurelia]|uniref:Uncharacterized protein n=1 Tax=Paramecium primaurelia TaxID=5886 RepID=A0A8S1LA39_PARPR|nr:unnamed protein product [Paramecium primaurelia]